MALSKVTNVRKEQITRWWVAYEKINHVAKFQLPKAVVLCSLLPWQKNNSVRDWGGDALYSHLCQNRCPWPESMTKGSSLIPFSALGFSVLAMVAVGTGTGHTGDAPQALSSSALQLLAGPLTSSTTICVLGNFRRSQWDLKKPTYIHWRLIMPYCKRMHLTTL